MGVILKTEFCFCSNVSGKTISPRSTLKDTNSLFYCKS